MSYWEAFWWGILGGCLPEFLYWAKLQKTFHKKKPDHVKSFYYWGFVIAWIIIAGLLPLIYLKAGININFLISIHIGATSPIILNQLVRGNLDIG